MARPPTPDTIATEERATIRKLTEQIAELETTLAELRTQRGELLVTAKRAGVTGDQLAADMGMTRRNAHKALLAAGYDPGIRRR